MRRTDLGNDQTSTLNYLRTTGILRSNSSENVLKNVFFVFKQIINQLILKKPITKMGSFMPKLLQFIRIMMMKEKVL